MSSQDTQTLYGRKACLAAYECRPHDILRIYHGREQAPLLAGMLRWAASQRIVYRELDEEGLRRVAKSTHHEGLVLATKPLRYRPLGEAEGAAHRRWLALDGVENPHNLGAILRSCAFFGVDALLAGGSEPGGKVNSAALRVAEGGAEYVPLFAASGLVPALEILRRGGRPVIGLETGAPPLPAGGELGGSWALVAGHERHGLSPAVRQACDAVHAIAGAGRLDSLNVSVAVGVALGRLAGDAPWKQGGRRRTKHKTGGRAGGKGEAASPRRGR
ncbi:MAG: RNA methyltransferase [SAR324 cluster bacterium]|nr:RNA methyltransferase [SAR324 cluster bacterium]